MSDGRERLLGGMVAVVGVAVVAVGGYTLLHPVPPQTRAVAVSTPSGQHTGSVTPPPRPRLSSPSPTPIPPQGGPTQIDTPTPGLVATTRAPLTVLNNTTIPGLGSRAAAQFENAGWTVLSVGNLRDDILSSCAYYDPDQASAQDAAAALKAQFPGLKRIEPKFTGLPPGPVVVVLTPDWS